MAWLRVTKHYKGHFPLDAGGVTFGGYGFKEVTPDEFAARCAAQNFPYVVPCNIKGEFLVDVPPLEPVGVAAPQLPVVEQAPPKSEAPDEAGAVDQNEDSVPSAIEIEKPSKKRK